MTPSPQNSAAPMRPRITTVLYWREPRPTADDASAVSAMMPPSPRLSARRIRTTYFSATTNIRVHTITEMTPMMLVAVSEMPWIGLNDSCTAYSGLVPISPYTTPMAPSVSAGKRAVPVLSVIFRISGRRATGEDSGSTPAAPLRPVAHCLRRWVLATSGHPRSDHSISRSTSRPRSWRWRCNALHRRALTSASNPDRG